MTQRTILAGPSPQVFVYAGANVAVQGVEGEQITAETHDFWGLKVERRKNTFKVKIGGSGQVQIPFRSNLKVYAGKNADLRAIQGDVTLYAGLHAHLREIGRIAHVSAGGVMDLDCLAVISNELKLEAGGDLTCHIRDLTSARIKVKDLGGFWEARIGDGRVHLTLKAGGDVILVTDQKVEPLPPDYILGKIIRPHLSEDSL